MKKTIRKYINRIFSVAVFAIILQISFLSNTVHAATVADSIFDAFAQSNISSSGGSGGGGGGNNGGGGGGTTAPSNPTPAPPPVQTEWDFSQNGVNIKSGCAPFVGEGATLLCPKAGSEFEYLGSVDPAQSAPDGNEQNLGIWRRGLGFNLMCGVKSRPGSTPPLAFQGADKLWVLPQCPETGSQVLQRLGADCLEENPSFVTTTILQLGSQGYCVQYQKAFIKIVILKQFYATTWKDPDGIVRQEDADGIRAFQLAMDTALKAADFNRDDTTRGYRQTYIDNGSAVANGSTGLALPVTGQFKKAEWNWLTVFTFLYITANAGIAY